MALQHLQTPPPSLRQKVPTTPAEVEEVVLTALEKDPQKRFASVQAFATALEQAGGSAMHVPSSRSSVSIEEGKGPRWVVELCHPIIFIGRGTVTEYIDCGSSAHLSLADRAVSRRHACLVHQADGNYWIEDEESASGVQINGRMLTGNKVHPLQNGDRCECYYDSQHLAHPKVSH
jgi:FHA domain